MKNFKTYHLSVDFFHELSNVKIPFYLQDQLYRAASSITLNLAEGSGKRTAKDQKKFFYQAYGSYKECKAIFDLMNIKNKNLESKLEILGAHLWKLVQYKI